ncbi:hypothetical protein L345_00784, partial [Ophiophagus hannah]
MAGIKGVVKEPLDPVSQNKIFTETLFHHAALEPPKKYTEPQTESQEIGWFSTPLISINRNDNRLHFPSRSTEISRYMAALWRLKEMTKSK